jgi:hypothetical protein
MVYGWLIYDAFRPIAAAHLKRSLSLPAPFGYCFAVCGDLFTLKPARQAREIPAKHSFSIFSLQGPPFESQA